MTENNVSVLEPESTDKGAEFITGLRTAAKAKSDPKGRVSALLAGASAILGDSKVAADETTRGEALVAEGRELLHRSETNLRRWTITAQIARDAGVSARSFGEITGSGKMILSRFAGAADLYDAAKKNKTPITIGQAMVRANRMGAGEVTALVAAYNGSPEGVDPETGVSSVTPKAQTVPTVESFVKRVDTLAEVLSTLLQGDYATPKADTLPAVQRTVETLRKMTEQADTLAKQVKAKGQTPKAAQAA